MTAENVEKFGFDGERLKRVERKIKRDIETGTYHGVSLILSRKGCVVLHLVSRPRSHVNGSAGRLCG